MSENHYFPKQSQQGALAAAASPSPARTLMDSSEASANSSCSESNPPMSQFTQNARAAVPVSQWSALDDDPIESFSEEDPISSFSDGGCNEFPRQFAEAGCSCIGFYGVCLCGGAQYMRSGQPSVDAVAEAPCQSDLWCAQASGRRVGLLSLPSRAPTHDETATPTMDGGMCPSQGRLLALVALKALFPCLP